jgi:mono/diheme cytochrome c family protein
MTVKRFWAGAAITAAASAVVLSAAGQQTSVTPSFTTEQVGAGRLVFQTNCATCHGADLSGGPYAPPLAGRAFVDVWSTRTIRDLIESIRTMPPTNPRMLDDDARLNLAAYILQANGLAAGPGPLTLATAEPLASLKTSRPALAAATPATEVASVRRLVVEPALFDAGGDHIEQCRFARGRLGDAASRTNEPNRAHDVEGPDSCTDRELQGGRPEREDRRDPVGVRATGATRSTRRRRRERCRSRVRGREHRFNHGDQCGDREKHVDPHADAGSRSRTTREHHVGTDVCQRCVACVDLGRRQRAARWGECPRRSHGQGDLALLRRSAAG